MQLVKPDVATICTGMAASMGAVLLCAGADGKRSCLPHSRVLIHQPLGGVQGQASDILIAAKEIEKTREELCSIVAYHTKVQVQTSAEEPQFFITEDAYKRMKRGSVDISRIVIRIGYA